ncbi:MAG TPA: class I SAM-dependent methyltransferase [Stellaceae bacterium]|nr:class I SAM-dependent methyltransferase [Stellaceae bacterium]
MLRDEVQIVPEQRQTRDAFGFKWARRHSYASMEVEAATRCWLVERYGDLSRPEAWLRFGEAPVVLDAGCGAGFTARLLLGDMLRGVRYVGVDLSEAVELAAENFACERLPGVFLQADLCTLPLPERAIDFIYSEGVMHHTPSTKAALLALSRHLKPGGVIAFYVYARKGPIREASDDLIRARLASLSPAEAWELLMPLTKLGKALGELNAAVDVPEDVALLGIPKGRIDVQRLIYWYFCKMYYRPDYSFDEMNHVNFDWFMPAYSHRQTPEEVRAWCEEAGLGIERMRVEEAGITTMAVRGG